MKNQNKINKLKLSYSSRAAVLLMGWCPHHIVSFMEPDTNVVSLDSILGAAFFVSCMVVGTVSICVGPREIVVRKFSFIRDLGFLLFVLLVLLMINIIGNINVFVALAFTSLYFVYVLLVSIGHLFWKELVCKLKRSLYGLKQAPRQSYKRSDTFMLTHGYTRSSYDSCVYFRFLSNGSIILLMLYVDDMLIACKHMQEIF